MEERSFRTILADFLEEKPLDPPRESVKNQSASRFSYEPTPLLEWRNRPDLKIGKKSPYPTPIRRAAKVETEKLLNVGQLLPEDQISLQLMITWGATELESGISTRRLKKAHRRLIKTLHPDHMDKSLTASQQQSQHEAFLALQATYESLNAALKKISDSACGNEFASAPGSRRPNAA